MGWASVSNGVFICLACAGIHRSLGVGVSVVRSVYMDAWTELQVISAVTFSLIFIAFSLA